MLLTCLGLDRAKILAPLTESFMLGSLFQEEGTNEAPGGTKFSPTA